MKSALRLEHVALGLVLLATHGWLFLMDGVWWDGLLIHSFHEAQDYGPLWTWFSDSGLPLYYYLHRALALGLGSPVGYRVWTFGALAVTAFSVHRVLVWLGVAAVERFFMAALATSFPLFHRVEAELILAPYAVLHALFWLAIVAACRAESATGIRHVLLRATSLCLLAVSFWMKSLVVFHLGLLTVVLLHRCWSSGLRTAREWLWSHADYAFLPFVFWFATASLFPASGVYATYNRLNPQSIPGAGFYFLKTIVWGIPLELAKTIATVPLVVAILWLGTFFGVRRLRGLQGEPSSHPSLPFAFAALVLLFFSILPYASVGQHATPDGWGARHGILAAAPASALVVIGMRALAHRHWAQVGPGVLGTLLVLFVATVANSQWELEARWAHDRALVATLEKNPALSRFTSLEVDPDLRFGGERQYRFYELASLFKMAWGDERHWGKDVRDSGAARPLRQFLTAAYNLSGYEPGGCAARLHVTAGTGYPGTAQRLAIAYFLARIQRGGKLEALLADLIRIDVKPAPGLSGPLCTTALHNAAPGLPHPP